MEGDGRSGLRCIIAPEQAEHLALKEYATIKLMQVIAERDAALVERDNALAEKKHALSERDAAFAQRDMAVAERDAAMMERDNAIAALDSARGHRSLSWNPYRRPELKGREAPVMQISLPNMNVMNFGMEDMHAFSAESPMLGFASSSDKVQPVQPSNGRKRKKDGSKVNKGKRMSGGVPDMLKLDVRHRHGEVQPNGSRLHELHEGMTPLLPSTNPFGLQEADQQPLENRSTSDCKELDMIISTPIPYCSCTGTNQPCYRWGNGGWQSACCTTTMSMHPLPMNPKKKGYRLPGRKMSAGAFQKLVARLSQEGVDLSVPIDLKNYWSKHGTNRYVTIK